MTGLRDSDRGMRSERSASLCAHRWRYLPTMDTNPPSEARECVVCGVVEQRQGVAVRADGTRIEPTEWARAVMDKRTGASA